MALVYGCEKGISGYIPKHDNSNFFSGVNHLCQPLSKLSSGLVYLNLSRTGCTSKGINRLAEALNNNRFMSTSLQTINLSHNTLRGDEISVSAF